MDELKKISDYVENPNIVRGLDYYTHTVFEIEADIKGFGSQNVLGAGGRYNNLVQNIGGPDIPGVGFAIGIERLLLALEMEGIDITSNSDPEIYVVPMGKDSVLKAFNLVNVLRLSGFNTEMDYNNRNLKSNFKNADRLHAKFIIIVGEEEINTKTLTIKDNSTKEEFKIKLDKLVEFLDDKILSTNDDK